MGVAEAADKTGEAALIDAAIERQPLIGARVNAFATRGAIREVGRVRSTKGNTHGHEIKVWQATR